MNRRQSLVTLSTYLASAFFLSHCTFRGEEWYAYHSTLNLLIRIPCQPSLCFPIIMKKHYFKNLPWTWTALFRANYTNTPPPTLRNYSNLLVRNFHNASQESLEGVLPCSANFAPLSPVSFLERAASASADKTSLVYGTSHYTWAHTHQRCLKLASALNHLGFSRGVVVSPMAYPSHPFVLDCQFNHQYQL